MSKLKVHAVVVIHVKTTKLIVANDDNYALAA